MLAAGGEGGGLMDSLKRQVSSLRVDRVRTQQRRGSEQQRVRQRIDQKQVPPSSPHSACGDRLMSLRLKCGRRLRLVNATI